MSIRITYMTALALLVATTGSWAQARRPARATGGAAPAQQAKAALPKGVTPFVQKEDNGQVNWTAQYIEATGEGIIDNERFKNPAQARAMAIRGATVVAQRNLLEIVKGVNVTSETTVEDMITISDKIVTKIEGVVKGAEPVGQPVIADGSVTVRLRMPLYAQNGLAPALYPDIPAETTPATADTATAGQAATATADKAAVPAKGLAFNLGGKEFDPALFPVIVDEKGNVLLETKKLYDPTLGKFPQVVNVTKQVLQAAGFKKGVELIDVISAQDGKIVISDADKSKVAWSKIFNTVKTIGKFLLMLV